MAYFTPGNNENIYQLLSRNNFTFIDQKIDDYKCIICQKILINAYQAFCGCNYCEKCVDEQVRSGVVFCPGDTEECKSTTLSSVVINHRMNRQIAQLVVKCPEELCCYESQLRNMGDHLRLCGKNVECPFTDFGCDRGKLKRDELNEHLQQECCRHSEILIEAIGNLRNELAELKRYRKKYDAVIDQLVKRDREKAVIIDSMKDEIESMKLEKTELKQRVDNLGNILDDKADKTELEEKVDNLDNILDGKADKTKLQQVVVSLCNILGDKADKTELEEKVDNLDNILDGKADKTELELRVDNLGNILDGKVDKIVEEIEAKLEEMRREWRSAMEQQQLALANVEERNEVKYRTEIAERIDSLEKCLAEKIDADFVWTIDNISEKRQQPNWGSFVSEYFNGCAEPYKMQFLCYNDDSELWIYFLIYSDDSNDSLDWPFDRNVTIAITNPKRPTLRKTVTKNITILEASNDWYTSSVPLIYKFDELSNEGLLHDDRLTLQCFIRNG